MVTEDNFVVATPQLTLVGKSDFSVLWWDIYDVELYSQTGTYSPKQKPLLLKLTYKRSISRDDLIEETNTQWKRFTIAADKKQTWLAELAQIWPDVNRMDSIAFYIDSQGVCRFYLNERFIGAVDDPEFSHYFALIWLDENGPYPSMTRDLIGKKN